MSVSCVSEEGLELRTNRVKQYLKTMRMADGDNLVSELCLPNSSLGRKQQQRPLETCWRHQPSLPADLLNLSLEVGLPAVPHQ